MQGEIKNGVLFLQIPIAKEPYVSATEKTKAEKEKRNPVAQMLASSGGFVRLPGCRVSLNVLTNG